MPLPRYRAIVKVLCEDCQTSVNLKQRFNTGCKRCSYLKYNNVNRLVKFKDFLNTEHPNWCWFNIYEYIKGENGKKINSYQKGKNEPITDRA